MLECGRFNSIDPPVRAQVEDAIDMAMEEEACGAPWRLVCVELFHSGDDCYALFDEDVAVPLSQSALDYLVRTDSGVFVGRINTQEPQAGELLCYTLPRQAPVQFMRVPLSAPN